MEKRLKAVVEGSGLKKKLDETGRHITQYSARHFAAVDALMRNVSVYDVAMNLGTSVNYIEKTYAKQLTAMMKQKELTKGQGYWKMFEERENMSEAEVEESRGEVKDLLQNLWSNEKNKLVLKHIHRKMEKGEKLTEAETKLYSLEWLDNQQKEFQDKHGISIQEHIAEKIKTNQELTPTEKRVLKISILAEKDSQERRLKSS